ncbi:MAG: Glu-tRNA(Gln) amidotransferase subunit GatD [Candidatus Woesearchaeota archaeon]
MVLNLEFIPGNFVKLETINGTFKGKVMPPSELAPKDVIIIKLDNGYNIGLKKNSIKNFEIIKEEKNTKEKIRKVSQRIKPALKQNKHLPKITILHTGGTIASRVDYNTGGVIANFEPKEIIAMFPEIREIAQIDSQLIGNLWSQDIRFSHYNLIGEAIKKEIKKGVKGIVITHGTDTLHYTGAALSFMFENLPIPIIIVGSQRSSDRGSSDAAFNLISAIAFIVNTNYKGVCTCLHENISDDSCLIINALKVRKMHTSRRDAFRPINTTAIARINYKTKQVEYLKRVENDSILEQEKELKYFPFNEKLKIGLIKTHTNMYAEQFDVYEKFDGLVIEATGLGNGPTTKIDNYTEENERIKEKIEKITKKIPVAITSQCIYGRINMNVYSNQRVMQEIGVLGHGCDMTPETAFIKLAWLISNYGSEDVKKLFHQNLRGEITERTDEDSFLS